VFDYDAGEDSMTRSDGLGCFFYSPFFLLYSEMANASDLAGYLPVLVHFRSPLVAIRRRKFMDTNPFVRSQIPPPFSAYSLLRPPSTSPIKALNWPLDGAPANGIYSSGELIHLKWRHYRSIQFEREGLNTRVQTKYKYSSSKHFLNICHSASCMHVF